MARTQDEIVQRMKQIKKADFFGFQWSALVLFLDFAHAKPYLVEDTEERAWNAVRAKVKSAREKILDYLPFAWEKANDCRGLSAMRSMEHFKAWTWLDGHDLSDQLDAQYCYFGKPCLVMVSELYDFDWTTHDDGQWRNEAYEPGLSAAEVLAHMEISSKLLSKIAAKKEEENGHV